MAIYKYADFVYWKKAKLPQGVGKIESCPLMQLAGGWVGKIKCCYD